MKLHEQVAQVSSKNDLVEFVQALRTDFLANPGAWENPTLERYLEALAAWIEDSAGHYRNKGEQVPTAPSWRNIAEMLYAAKMYE